MDPETLLPAVPHAPKAYELSTAAIQQKVNEESAPLARQDRTVLKTAFDAVDADGSGAISMPEMTKFLAQLEWDLTAQDAFRFLDKDESDSLTFKEFLRWKGFAWEKQVALQRRNSSRSFASQSKLDQIVEDEDEDTDEDEDVDAGDANKSVAELQEKVETLQYHLVSLHEQYADLCEVLVP